MTLRGQFEKPSVLVSQPLAAAEDLTSQLRGKRGREGGKDKMRLRGLIRFKSHQPPQIFEERGGDDAIDEN